ncbi:hypothetical protein GGTG_02568 [Gaeumannomyces tritici R3-111a-1]|uniref:Gamma-glutamylcyclotransferase AIG2-like domain-containing protein n=1 Tax=Gaeumannomyces tritici (strain R3-111a-1) TaxID=644352 RepID=J3NMR2_GAET3|nr:hypothetical protein GGTG_02568 [Gaeumannomyces tritici R3-111a-1]EJT82595.1 hypothetical protein GGTG_02568 [Gaeumannomyces tritici R3-111a-1]
MPQFRPPDGCPPQRPAWDEYPVWYLFYGTLATPDVLARVLHLELGDGGIYKALVQAEMHDAKVGGSAYMVESREEEDALRAYETDKYLVARSAIRLVGKGFSGDNGSASAPVVPGLTFLFRGVPDNTR